MTRSRNSAKSAGTSFERAIADYLNREVDDRIDRRVKTGAKDRGDIAGVRAHGQRVVIECKEYGGRLEPVAWTREAHVEARNDDALVGVVAAKRRGTTDPARQWVVMEVADFVALLTGTHPTGNAE